MSVYTDAITQKVFSQFFVYNIGPSHDHSDIKINNNNIVIIIIIANLFNFRSQFQIMTDTKAQFYIQYSHVVIQG